MHDVPYHNFRHVVDVTHSCYRFLRLTEGSCLFSVWEQVSLLVAALCHDLDHPGDYIMLKALHHTGHVTFTAVKLEKLLSPTFCTIETGMSISHLTSMSGFTFSVCQS